jgi:type 1 glutamine amidotransferase
MGPQFQEATIRVEAPVHPALAHLEREWVRTEEWYSFAKSPRETGARILATLDESTYAPDFKLFFIDRDLRMGADHPIIWSQCIGRGRSLYSALGHQAEAYSEPEHLELLEEGVAWLLDDASNDCGSGSAH